MFIPKVSGNDAFDPSELDENNVLVSRDSEGWAVPNYQNGLYLDDEEEE